MSAPIGLLAGFAEDDDNILKSINKKFAGSNRNKSKTCAIEIRSKDSLSKPNRAAAVACEMIRSEEVDAIVAVSTPDMVNPMSDQADLNRAPCVTAACRGSPPSLTGEASPPKLAKIHAAAPICARKPLSDPAKGDFFAISGSYRHNSGRTCRNCHKVALIGPSNCLQSPRSGPIAQPTETKDD